MSSIQKITNLKGISYRVFIRRKGIKTITKTFPSKELASQFVLKLEGDRQLLLAFGGKSSKITFNELTVDYLLNGFKGKGLIDQKSKLNYWNKLIGKKELIYVTRSDISDGLNKLTNKLTNATINRYKAYYACVQRAIGYWRKSLYRSYR